MPVSESYLRDKILESFPDAIIDIQDTVGDQNHYSMTVTSSKFKDLNKISQHRLVNEALKDCLGGELHALSIKTIVKN